MMGKSRAVLITIELVTDLPLGTLRGKSWWDECLVDHKSCYLAEVRQVQANVIKKDR